jgi:WD40 repeat protein
VRLHPFSSWLKYYSICYSIDPWEKRWSKKLNTRMYDSRHLSFNPVLTTNSGYAAPNHDGKLLLVSNLKDGIDEYQFPSMERVQTFTFPTEVNCILQTKSLPQGNLIVVGGDDGFARVFNRISGQLVSEIHHRGKHPAYLHLGHIADAPVWRVAVHGQLVQVIEVSHTATKQIDLVTL